MSGKRGDDDMNEVVDLVHSLVIKSRKANTSAAPAPIDDTPPQGGIKSVPSSPSLVISRSQSFPVRKRVPFKSVPLSEAPDIGNATLFPSVEESNAVDSPTSSSTKGMPLRNAFPNMISDKCPSEQKLKSLEDKLTRPFGTQNTNVSSASNPPRRLSLNLSELPTTPNRKTPRSAKLFSELTSERRQKLDELAEKYSVAIDSNQCRHVLDEIEFVLQLFNTPTTSSVKISQSDDDTLMTAAEHAYFAIKVIINQLNKIGSSLPLSVIQLIIDNYPHKIPKPVRKHIEDWICARRTEPSKSCESSESETLPAEGQTVTFKSNTDGKPNFPCQTDFHAFCKQRDMFFVIRENWTSSTASANIGSVNGFGRGTGEGDMMITERTKARMSFPPANNATSTPSAIESLPFKVQSLFQISCKPINLSQFASLFVSHYLLEVRALEVGGVPKDDNMKEFFQSNLNKLRQLNNRFSMGASETLDGEGFLNFAFHKEFLTASSPKFVQHVINRLVAEIQQAEEKMGSHQLDSASDICRLIKDTVHLARLLGFAIFLPYNDDDGQQKEIQWKDSIEKESMLRQQLAIRSCHTPPLDLCSYLQTAFQNGRLMGTCPWILEYLQQGDSISLQLPVYKSIIAQFFWVYKSVLDISSKACDSMPNPTRNFLRFHIGVLFSSKKFPDSVISFQKAPESSVLSQLVYDSENIREINIDSMENVGCSLIEFFFNDTFNRMKRILSWGKLEISHPAMTGEIRHIRPIPASEKSLLHKETSGEDDVQARLEVAFFELYPPIVKRSVDFVSERTVANFIERAKSQIFPNMRTTLANQGIFGVRAAEKCRVKIVEEMRKYLTEKCNMYIKMCLEETASLDVQQICQRIALRNAKFAGYEWIGNYITAAMFPDIGLEVEAEDQPKSSSPTPDEPSSPMSSSELCSTDVTEDPPYEILVSIHQMIRQMCGKEEVDPTLVDAVFSCQPLFHASYMFQAMVEWGICLIAFQPKLMNPLRIKQLTSLWKSLWSGDAEVINARNLMLVTKSDDPRDSWIKLGTVTQNLISEGVIKADDLEQQCLTLLREDWPDQTHKRISEFLTLVLEAFHERSEWHSESAQVLDWVAWLCSGQPDQD